MNDEKNINLINNDRIDLLKSSIANLRQDLVVNQLREELNISKVNNAQLVKEVFEGISTSSRSCKNYS